ncbi:hypothetical protein TVAG_280560 [Trichomonas vaginalis G3]|uniref:Protein kinase domain-containing protein n=1 Tax=Trichomonas vaginalis (strain ATCC PRA-98 / G3) TaxID=412133 RepID=A2DRH7_TRIV3|nr:hypothetical protein TVAG_280560 [Trichomonas vaginalis G3]|eukprot:XP_001329163.1 hypothetical protein [Trichomonas vaginalis G3]
MSDKPSEIAQKYPRTIGKYRILKTIGKGSYATVVSAFDTKLKQTVAIKMLIANSSQSVTWLHFLKPNFDLALDLIIQTSSNFMKFSMNRKQL